MEDFLFARIAELEAGNPALAAGLREVLRFHRAGQCMDFNHDPVQITYQCGTCSVPDSLDTCMPLYVRPQWPCGTAKALIDGWAGHPEMPAHVWPVGHDGRVV